MSTAEPPFVPQQHEHRAVIYAETHAVREAGADLVYYLSLANPFTHAVELIRYAAYGKVNLIALAVVAGARASWRTDPSRYQDAGAFRACGPPHHRRPHRPIQKPGRRLGICPCLYRRCLPYQFTDIFPDQKATSAIAFLKAAIAYYQSLGVTVTRVMTDNGSCYKAFAFRDARKELGLRHIRTRPFTPKTNGKAERFIKTALGEWAYARAYSSSDQRAAQLPIWTHIYNWHRPHGSLNSKPPISVLNLSEDNLLNIHS